MLSVAKINLDAILNIETNADAFGFHRHQDSEAHQEVVETLYTCICVYHQCMYV